MIFSGFTIHVTHISQRTVQRNPVRNHNIKAIILINILSPTLSGLEFLNHATLLTRGRPVLAAAAIFDFQV